MEEKLLSVIINELRTNQYYFLVANSDEKSRRSVPEPDMIILP